MSTATLPPRTAARPSRPGQTPRPRPGAGDSSAVGVVLIRYAGTLLPLAAVLVALQIGEQLLADGAGTPGRGWPVAVAAAGGWALAVAVWLRRHGWTAAHLATVIAGPVAVLAASAAAGWLSAAGLLLWGPVSTVLAVALVMAAQPLPPAAPHPTEPAATRA
jgi:hypothetical protein